MALSDYVTTYPEILDLLRKELSSKLGIDVDVDDASFVGNYLHLLSVLAEDSFYYLKLLHNETFLSRALLESSIYEHALSLGYSPSVATPAVGEVMLHIPLTNWKSFKCDPQFLEFVADDPLIVYTSQNAISLNYDIERGIYLAESISPTSRIKLPSYVGRVVYKNEVVSAWNISIPVVQARRVIIDYVLRDKDVDNYMIPTIEILLNSYFSMEEIEKYQIGEIEVVVNGVKYQRYNSLFELERGATGYVLRVDNDRLVIQLGNGIFGKRHTAGTVVYITVQMTAGSKGGVSANSLRLTTTLTDSYTKSVIHAFSSHLAIPGGKDKESPNSVRINTIRSLRSRDRLVSGTDIVDLFKLNFDDMFNDVHPVVRVSDFSANETNVFVVPHINNKPLKCNSLYGKFALVDTTTRKLFRKGQSVQFEGERWVVPFDVYAQPYSLSYIFIPDNITTNLTTVVKTPHFLDSTMEANVTSLALNYIMLEEKYEVKLYLLVSKGNGFQDNFFDSFNVNVSLNDTVTNEKVEITTWDIVEWTDNSTFVTLSLQASIPSSYISTNVYMFDCSIVGKVSDTESLIYNGYVSGLQLKFDFSKIFNIRYINLPQDSECGVDCAYVYDIPVIEYNEYKEKFDQIESWILGKLQRFSNWVDFRRMVTNKVNIAFARTYGKIRNLKYNPRTAVICYGSECDYPPLPLKVKIDIVVDKGYDVNVVLTELRTKLWEFLSSGGIHKTVLLEDIYKVVRSVDGVISSKIIEPNVPIYYDFDPQLHIPKNEIRTYVPEYIWVEDVDSIIINVVGNIEINCD